MNDDLLDAEIPVAQFSDRLQSTSRDEFDSVGY